MTNKLPAILLSTSAIFAMNGAVAKSEKPNILFICIDDLRTQIGAYGHDYMITPNLDKIASEGRLFTNQFTQLPTSGPSRACMLTGKAVTCNEDINHHLLARKLKGSSEGELPETFVHHLKRNGYYTVGMGKVSHSPIGKNGANNELPHSWNEFLQDPNSKWKGGALHGYANGRVRSKNKAENPVYEFKDLPDTGYPDGGLANLATAQLEKLAKGDKPFFMAVGFYKPHLPFCAPKKYWDLYDSKDIELSPNKEAPKGVDPVFLHNSTEFFGTYTNRETGGAGVVISDEYARDLRHANYAALSYTDAQVGKLMAKYKELGLDKNTIVVVWGDHGWHLGDQTIWGKHSAFNRAYNSTFMVTTPDMKQRGKSTDALVAAIDIYPTICDLAGVETPSSTEGESFVAALKNPKADGKEYVVSYWRDIISLRTDRYRMALYNDGTKECVMLFDHESDPNESINVAAQNPDVVKELTEKIKEANNGFLPHLGIN